MWRMSLNPALFGCVKKRKKWSVTGRSSEVGFVSCIAFVGSHLDSIHINTFGGNFKAIFSTF